MLSKVQGVSRRAGPILPGVSSAADRLRRRIAEHGPLPFAEFMEAALYGPGGYYRRDPFPAGRDGDYVTAATLSPLFGRATARLLARLDGVLGKPAQLFEAGCGDGAHLAAVIDALGGEGGAVGGRRLRGWDRVARPLPPGADAAADPAGLAAGEVDGLVFSYELFDALPVHRLVGRDEGGPGELWVGLAADGRLAFQTGELSDPRLAGLLGPEGAPLAPGQIADLAPGWRPLYRALARLLGRGLLVTCDYGFERHRLLDPRVRPAGTLACYRRHRVHRDPLVAVGEQDLTAHVDFTALREEGERAGLATVTLTRQARWLTACGLFDGLAAAPAAERLEAMTLLDGEGMGEDVRVLVQARGVAPEALFDLGLLVPSPAAGGIANIARK